jgi:hypothetical protein
VLAICLGTRDCQSACKNCTPNNNHWRRPATVDRRPAATYGAVSIYSSRSSTFDLLPITPSLSNLKTVLTNQRVVGSIEFFDPSALVEIRRRAQGDSLHRSSVSYLAPIISLSLLQGRCASPSRRSFPVAPGRLLQRFLLRRRGASSPDEKNRSGAFPSAMESRSSV